jgi:hypothetical protein
VQIAKWCEQQSVAGESSNFSFQRLFFTTVDQASSTHRGGAPRRLKGDPAYLYKVTRYLWSTRIVKPAPRTIQRVSEGSHAPCRQLRH